MKDGDTDFGPKPVKVFDELINHKDAHDIISLAWSKKVDSWNPDSIFRNKLKIVKQDLRKWFSTSPNKLKTEIDEITKKITEWEFRAETNNLTDEQILEWQKDREIFLSKEKTRMEMLKQKARCKWALEGDENSKFFHSTIRRLQNKNNIHGVNINGIWSNNLSSIKSEAHSHFKKLFTKSQNDKYLLDTWNGSSITQDEAVNLESPFSENEILETVKSCGQDKAPGPGGFNLIFYSKYWDIIKVIF
ncbi:uncharacterized protein [Rutidosis leptorrhynchoides]|uniref:uncharacterized protein n=1 Tax=Rutidosis leptorrhynchoides TaxID=125765 RepID=UPI003A997B21